MACHLFGTNPLTEPMLTCQLDIGDKIMEFEPKYKFYQNIALEMLFAKCQSF